MPRDRFIVGPGITPSEEKKFEQFIRNYRRWETFTQLEGEIEKTDEQKFMAQIALYILYEELKNLDFLLDPNVVSPNGALISANFHILRHEEFLKVSKRGYGAATGRKGQAYFDNEELSQLPRLLQLISFLHEAIHLTGHYKAFRSKKEKSMYDYRLGYRTRIPQAEFLGHEHFSGFDEAIVQKITLWITEKNKEMIKSAYNLTEEQWEQEFSHAQEQVGYDRDVNLLNFIVSKIAIHNHESSESVWSRFEIGHFTGDMMHLRDIEKVFGNGSLRVIAAYQLGNKSPLSADDQYIFTVGYFTTGNEAKKQKYANALLNPREAAKYNKRNNLKQTS